MADLRWWEQATPIGTIRLLAGDDGLRRVALPGATSSISVEAAIEDRDDDVASELDEYFARCRRRFTVALDLTESITPFRRRVLETLRDDVGFGETLTYGELAERAGHSGAARAVGSAMATNPLPIVVGCHRVLGASGGLGGYGGGLAMKRALLALEGVEPAVE